MKRLQSVRTILGAALLATAGLSGCDEALPGEPLPDPLVIGETGSSPGQFMKPRAMDADSTSIWVIDKTARVQRLDPATGDPISVWSMPESAAGKPVGITVVERAPGPDLVATPDRPLVFIADTHYHRVLVYRAPAPGGGPDAAPEEVARFGEYGRAPGQFIYPTDVAVIQGPGGRIDRILVAEYGGNDRIQIFDSRYQWVGAFGSFGPTDDPEEVIFNRPQSIDTDPASGDLLVADAGNHRIGRFSPEGELRGWIDGTAGAPGAEAVGAVGAVGVVGVAQGDDASPEAPVLGSELRYPYGVLAVGDGTMLIAEYGRNQVRRIDLEDGRTLGVWGRPGREVGELMTPWAVAMDGRTVYVLDTGHDRVQGFRAGFAARRGR